MKSWRARRIWPSANWLALCATKTRSRSADRRSASSPLGPAARAYGRRSHQPISAADGQGRAQCRRDRLRRMPGHVSRARREKAMRVVGETEFVVGQAAMADSGYYGKARACAGIVGHIDLTIGATPDASPMRRSRLAAGAFAAFAMQSARCRARNTHDIDSAATGRARRDLPAWLRGTGKAQSLVRCLALSSADRRTRRSRRRWFPTQSSRSLRRAARRRSPTAADDLRAVAGLDPRSRQGDRMSSSSSAASAWRSTATTFTWKDAPPSSRHAGRRVEAVVRNLHRGVWAAALHVREQFPVDKGQLLHTTLWNAFKRSRPAHRTANAPPSSTTPPRASTGSHRLCSSTRRRISLRGIHTSAFRKKHMKSRAAVAWEANKPLTIETIEIGSGKGRRSAGRDHGDGVCHTDAYAVRPGFEGKFPRSWGMRARASFASGRA